MEKAMADKSINERLGDICTTLAGGMQAPIDFIGLVISVLMPLLQNCFTKGTSPDTVASFVKNRPLVASVSVWTAIRQAGLMSHPKARLIYDTIIEAGRQATGKDVTEFLTENEV